MRAPRKDCYLFRVEGRTFLAYRGVVDREGSLVLSCVCGCDDLVGAHRARYARSHVHIRTSSKQHIVIRLTTNSGWHMKIKAVLDEYMAAATGKGKEA